MYNYEKDGVMAFVFLLIGIGLLVITPTSVHPPIALITTFVVLITASGIARSDRD